MSNAIESQGITIQRGDGGSPETFATIAEITDFDGPGGSASEIDTTSLDSTAKEFLVGLKDEGNFSFNANLVTGDTPQSGLRTDRDNRTLRSFKITLTDTSSTTLTFSAYVMQFSISGAVDDKVSVAVTLRVSGAVTWA